VSSLAPFPLDATIDLRLNPSQRAKHCYASPAIAA